MSNVGVKLCLIIFWGMLLLPSKAEVSSTGGEWITTTLDWTLNDTQDAVTANSISENEDISDLDATERTINIQNKQKEDELRDTNKQTSKDPPQNITERLIETEEKAKIEDILTKNVTRRLNTPKEFNENRNLQDNLETTELYSNDTPQAITEELNDTQSEDKENIVTKHKKRKSNKSKMLDRILGEYVNKNSGIPTIENILLDQDSILTDLTPLSDLFNTVLDLTTEDAQQYDVSKEPDFESTTEKEDLKNKEEGITETKPIENQDYAERALVPNTETVTLNENKEIFETDWKTTIKPEELKNQEEPGPDEQKNNEEMLNSENNVRPESNDESNYENNQESTTENEELKNTKESMPKISLRRIETDEQDVEFTTETIPHANDNFIEGDMIQTTEKEELNNEEEPTLSLRKLETDEQIIMTTERIPYPEDNSIGEDLVTTTEKIQLKNGEKTTLGIFLRKLVNDDQMIAVTTERIPDSNENSTGKDLVETTEKVELKNEEEPAFSISLRKLTDDDQMVAVTTEIIPDSNGNSIGKDLVETTEKVELKNEGKPAFSISLRKLNDDDRILAITTEIMPDSNDNSTGKDLVETTEKVELKNGEEPTLSISLRKLTDDDQMVEITTEIIPDSNDNSIGKDLVETTEKVELKNEEEPTLSISLRKLTDDDQMVAVTTEIMPDSNGNSTGKDLVETTEKVELKNEEEPALSTSLEKLANDDQMVAVTTERIPDSNDNSIGKDLVMATEKEESKNEMKPNLNMSLRKLETAEEVLDSSTERLDLTTNELSIDDRNEEMTTDNVGENDTEETTTTLNSERNDTRVTINFVMRSLQHNKKNDESSKTKEHKPTNEKHQTSIKTESEESASKSIQSHHKQNQTKEDRSKTISKGETQEGSESTTIFENITSTTVSKKPKTIFVELVEDSNYVAKNDKNFLQYPSLRKIPPEKDTTNNYTSPTIPTIKYTYKTKEPSTWMTFLTTPKTKPTTTVVLTTKSEITTLAPSQNTTDQNGQGSYNLNKLSKSKKSQTKIITKKTLLYQNVTQETSPKDAAIQKLLKFIIECNSHRGNKTQDDTCLQSKSSSNNSMSQLLYKNEYYKLTGDKHYNTTLVDSVTKDKWLEKDQKKG